MNAWARFFIRYVLIGAAGMALLVVLVPPPGRQGPAPGRHAPARDTAARDAADARQQEALRKLAEDSQHVVDLLDPLPPSPSGHDAPASAAMAPSHSLPASPASATAPTSSPANARWGVVSEPNTPYYNTSGAFLGHLAPGALLDVLAMKQNKATPLLVCRATTGRDTSSILVKAEQVEIHPGRLDDMSYELKQLYAERARIQIEIDTREQQRKSQLRGENPYAKAFAKARSEYTAYWERVKELKAGHDAATGADRAHYANELRKMKGRDITLRTNYDDAKGKYDEWNDQHPEVMLSPPTADPLAEELKRIETQIETIVRENG